MVVRVDSRVVMAVVESDVVPVLVAVVLVVEVGTWSDLWCLCSWRWWWWRWWWVAVVLVVLVPVLDAELVGVVVGDAVAVELPVLAADVVGVGVAVLVGVELVVVVVPGDSR